MLDCHGGQESRNSSTQQKHEQFFRYESGNSSSPPLPGSPSRAQKLLDRLQNVLAVGDAAGDDVFVVAQQFVDVVEELAAAVRAFHLAVAEQVHLGHQPVLDQVHPLANIVAPI